MKRKKAKSVDATKQPRFYILWNPASEKPPRVRYSTRKEAQQVADDMVRRHREQFYVMGSFEMREPLKQVKCTDYSAREVKVAPAPIPVGRAWKSYDEWKAAGYQVRRGEKASYTQGSGPKFNQSQVDLLCDEQIDYDYRDAFENGVD